MGWNSCYHGDNTIPKAGEEVLLRVEEQVAASTAAFMADGRRRRVVIAKWDGGKWTREGFELARYRLNPVEWHEIPE